MKESFMDRFEAFKERHLLTGIVLVCLYLTIGFQS